MSPRPNRSPRSPIIVHERSRPMPAAAALRDPAEPQADWSDVLLVVVLVIAVGMVSAIGVYVGGTWLERRPSAETRATR